MTAELLTNSELTSSRKSITNNNKDQRRRKDDYKTKTTLHNISLMLQTKEKNLDACSITSAPTHITESK
jgi:hypothetical protein